MEIRVLKSYVAVATLKNFSAAARELNTVQPAISRQIADLEEELGVSLLWRNTREVKVTAAGESLLRDAGDIIARESEAKEQARRTARGETGRLRIGYLGPACLGFIPDLMGAFSRRFPDVHVTLKEMTVQQQLDAFGSDQIDAGFGRPMAKSRSKGFIAEDVYQDSLVAVVPATHSLASAENLLVRQLRDDRFVLFSRDEAVGLFDQIIGMCQGDKFTPGITSQPDNMQTVLTEVASGLGVSIMPGCCRQLYTKGCVFIPIRNRRTAIPTVLHYRSDPISPTVEALAVLVREARAGIREQMSAGLGCS